MKDEFAVFCTLRFLSIDGSSVKRNLQLLIEKQRKFSDFSTLGVFILKLLHSLVEFRLCIEDLNFLAEFFCNKFFLIGTGFLNLVN